MRRARNMSAAKPRRAEKDKPGALERSIERRMDSSTGVSTNTSQPSGAQSMVLGLSADYPIA